MKIRNWYKKPEKISKIYFLFLKMLKFLIFFVLVASTALAGSEYFFLGSENLKMNFKIIVQVCHPNLLAGKVALLAEVKPNQVNFLTSSQ